MPLKLLYFREDSECGRGSLVTTCPASTQPVGDGGGGGTRGDAGSCVAAYVSFKSFIFSFALHKISITISLFMQYNKY